MASSRAPVILALTIVAGVAIAGGSLLFLGLREPPAAKADGTAAPSALTSTPAEPQTQDTPSAAASARPSDPRRIEEILSAADRFVADGEANKARVTLAAAVQSYPADQSLRIRFARVLGSLQQHNEAHEQYEKALAIGPRSPTIEFEAGTMANAAGRLERALEHYAAAQTLDPANADYPLYLGVMQHKLKQNDEAKASLMRSAKLRPDAPAAWGVLAEIAMEENKPTIARQHISRARELEPKATAWRMIEARVLNRLGKPDDALGVIAGIPDAERRTLAVARLEGESLGMLRRVSDAAAVFVQASEARPEDPDLALEAATWLERAGDTTKAKAYAARAVMLGNPAADAVKKRLDAATESK